MNYLQEEEKKIAMACHNYADFHIMTMKRVIIDKDTGEPHYKPAIFHDLSPSDKKKLLKNEHPNYKLIQK